MTKDLTSPDLTDTSRWPSVVAIPDWILFRRDISDGARMMYAVLGLYADLPERSWPGIAGIAKRLGVNESTVRRRLKELIDAGIVTLDLGKLVLAVADPDAS